jgi:hypothetical protein
MIAYSARLSKRNATTASTIMIATTTNTVPVGEPAGAAAGVADWIVADDGEGTARTLNVAHAFAAMGWVLPG